MPDQQDPAAFFRSPGVRAPALSPLGDRVAFLHGATGRPELYVLALDGDGTPTRLTDGDLHGNAGGTRFAWNAAGDGLYVVVSPADDDRRSVLIELGLDGGRRAVCRLGGPTGIHDVAPDGEVLVRDARNDRSPSWHVDRIDPTTGDRERFLNVPWVRDAAYAPSGAAVGYTVLDRSGSGPKPEPEARVVDRDGRNRVDIDVGGAAAVVGWLDDRRLAVVDPTDGSVIVWNRGPGTATAVEAAAPDDRPLGVFGDDRVLVVRDGRPTILEGADARSADLPHGDRVTAGAAVRDQAVLVADRPAVPAALLAWGGDGEPRPLFVPTAPDYAPPPTPEEVTIEGPDGKELPGLLFLPPAAGGEPDHGDDHGSDGDGVPGVVWPYTHRPAPHAPAVYLDAVRLLLDRGYAVLVPGNRPEPFSAAVQADVAAAGRWLAGHDATDGRVAVYGHSTGGYDALMGAALYPDVWAAAAASNAPADLLMLDDYRGGPADLRDYLPDPDADPDTWRELSPVHRAGAVNVPVLLLHAEHDTRVPYEQAERMVEALREAGVEEGDALEFATLTGQGHFSRAVTDRVARWTRVLAFFDDRL